MITINTETSIEDVKKLLKEKEQRDLEALRAGVRLSSIEDANERLEFIGLQCETTLHLVEEAYTELGDDEFDDFELAKAKADRIQQIERQNDRAIAQWENQVKRIEWERRQASK